MSKISNVQFFTIPQVSNTNYAYSNSTNPITNTDSGFSIFSNTLSKSNNNIINFPTSISDEEANTDQENNTQEPKEKYVYELGEKYNDSTRIIDENAVSFSVSTESEDEKTENNFLSLTLKNKNDTKKISNAATQGQRGDCYFLAAINAIKNTKNGEKILNKNVQENEDGTYTITLPGAIKLREEYLPKCEEQNVDCPITGTYIITKEAVEKAKKLSGKSYSQGDLKSTLLEVAMENYRKELQELQKTLDISTDDVFSAESQDVNDKNNNDYLSGGVTFDASFILTGNKAEDIYIATNDNYDNVNLYNEDKYRTVSREEMENETNVHNLVEVENVSQDKNDISEFLNKYKGKEDDYALTFGVVCAQKGPDGNTKERGGHALSIAKITDENVYVQNPWYPDKIQVIPREEFESMVTKLGATKVD